MSKTKTTTRSIWIGLLILLSTIFIGMLLMLWSSLWKSFPIQGQKQLLSIQNGDSYSRFIDRLAMEDQVNFPIILKAYHRFFIKDSLKAGVYEITSDMRMKDVLHLLSDSKNAQMNRILVIEGTNFKQLLQMLKDDDLVKKEVAHLPYAQLLTALEIPYTHPEGLFAPNTYFFAKGETDKNILKNLYQRQMKALDAAWQNRAADAPYKNKYEALIMASIIEKETNLDSELNQVSGVFARRLRIGMRLQTDPTVIYGMGDAYNGNITRKDLRTPTVYNTYTISGLPPTPIALPSQKAIEATLHPDQANTLYFVATGNGGHKFSTTLDEHNRAVQEYLTVLRSKKD